jgi:beta-lactamase class A
MKVAAITVVLLPLCVSVLTGCRTTCPSSMNSSVTDQIGFHSPTDAGLQQELERIDRSLQARHGISHGEVAVGVFDLKRFRLAMIDPDRMDYAASVAKIAILLAWFQLRPAAVTNLDSDVRHELGLMIKASSNTAATRFSSDLGLRAIQQVLDSYGFYDARHGGGLWMGKHYGRGGERFGDPIGNHSHAATVRQLLRFYVMLEQGKLVSPAASGKMREIFASPKIAHDSIKFVKGLEGRQLEVLRKWGTWEDWRHDSALVRGPGRHYILVALTHHPKGDEYLTDLARAVDDELLKAPLSDR